MAAADAYGVFYWRERNREVAFIVRVGRTVTAIEGRSCRRHKSLVGFKSFATDLWPKHRLPTGGDGIALGDVSTRPANSSFA